jgi:hypothetical protein
MNEEGEIIEYAQDPVEEAPEIDYGGEVEMGLEDDNFEPNTANLRLSVQQQTKLRDMFNVHQSKKF